MDNDNEVNVKKEDSKLFCEETGKREEVKSPHTETINQLKEIVKDTKINLCTTCMVDIQTCEATIDDIEYGDAVGNDNVIGCKKYVIPMMDEKFKSTVDSRFIFGVDLATENPEDTYVVTEIKDGEIVSSKVVKRKRKIGIDFLHPHPVSERELSHGLRGYHIIVDGEDWELVVKFFQNNDNLLQELE